MNNIHILCINYIQIINIIYYIVVLYGLNNTREIFPILQIITLRHISMTQEPKYTKM